MPSEKLQIGQIAQDVAEQVATQKTNQLLNASATAEQGRATAENNRVSAESARAEAESARASAESQRVEEFAQVRDTMFSAAMFAVSDYDPSTGEVELEYSSEAITDISYDSSTGEITFTY